MKRWASKVWWLAPVLILLAAVGGAWLALRPHSQIVTCTGAQSSQFSCWQQRYNAIVKEQSPEAAMKDFKQAYNTNAFLQSDCHQIAHVIGRAAAKRYKTLQLTYAHGDNFCASGYYHGAVETMANLIGTKAIEAQINTICEPFFKKQAYGLEHYNCVHGLGHGVMAIENGELFTALKLCDKLDGTWQQESCHSGVFMENIMNEINPGKQAKYLKADDPLYPCTAVADSYKEGCYLIQTSHSLIVEKYDYAKVFADCATVPSPFDATCYQSLGRDVSGLSLNSQGTTLTRCMLGQTQSAQNNCFIGAVKDFIYHYHSDTQGLALCTAIQDATLSANCTQTAHDYYSTF